MIEFSDLYWRADNSTSENISRLPVYYHFTIDACFIEILCMSDTGKRKMGG